MNIGFRKVVAPVFLVAILLSVWSVAAAQADAEALDKAGLIKTVQFMKQTGSSDQETARVVSNAGVNFKPTAVDERELRQAGASDAVIAAARNSYRGETEPKKEQQEKPADPPKEKIDEPKPPIKIQPPKDNPPREQTPAPTPKATGPRPKKPDKDFKFKVGDRVEADALMSSTPSNASYRKATIVGLDDANPADKAYLVQIDGQNPVEPKRYIIRPYTTHWLKAVQEGAQTPDKDFKFKVGDQVEVDSLMSSDPRNARYQPATIIALDDANPADKAYMVQIEGELQPKRYIIRPYTKHWVRAPE